MNWRLEPISVDDRKPIVDIFNYYVENSFAAYPENKVPDTFFDVLLEKAKGYPTVVAKDERGTILGFGMLRVHSPISSFSQTAEITYFIRREKTGKGIGSLMLEYLLAGAKKKGISSILASISSLNEGSLRFHKKHGFVECGRFRQVGKKKGTSFDVIWMQKML
jgi:L-amino acid N-acyltransferase YncA